VPVCGDGLLDAPEQCELPGTATCDAECRDIVCGNGIVQPGEECEGPNTATCDVNCQRIPDCGDAYVDAPEECEPPNSQNCDASCKLIACGNGTVQPGEECEPPNTTFCDNVCQRIPLCGDTFVDASESVIETCDPPDGVTCDTDCTLIECGNGQVEVGEECDPPGTASCDAACQRLPVCGDGFIDAPEQCEGPNTSNCDANCLLIDCGNGVVQPGEECEPPSTTTCDASCQRVPTCGDNLLDSPPEQCEPPNTTTCGPTCLLKELCTDGTDNDGDGLIDCLDPDCPVCPPPKKDPATIKFGRIPGTDRFKAHGSLQSANEDLTFDPATESVTVVLSNARTIILRATLTPGMMTSKVTGSADFRDRTFAAADGLYRMKIRTRRGLWVFSILARGDYSVATDPQMNLSINVGSQSVSATRNWAPKTYGWYLGFDRLR
jgi:hypothetical protein